MRDEISILDLPANIASWGTPDNVVIPPIPPACSEDYPVDLQQCPNCRALVTVEDPGISYCYRCLHLIFAGDDLNIIRPEPLPYHCPECGGILEDNDSEWTGVDGFFCRLCGQVMYSGSPICDGYQIVDPEAWDCHLTGRPNASQPQSESPPVGDDPSKKIK